MPVPDHEMTGEPISRWATTIVLVACLSSFAHPQLKTSTKAQLSPHQRQALAQLQEGNAQEALAEFRAAVAENPDDAVSHDYIGVILGESGKLNEALSEFERAARLEPSFPDSHFHLGVAYDRKGRTGDAIAQYQEALRLNPGLVEARYGLSAICAKIGDLDGAIRLLRDVIVAEPSFAEGHYNLGLNLWNRYKGSTGLRQKADLDQASEELKTAQGLAPQESRVYFALGQLMADRGDLVVAVENLQRAVDLDASNPEYHYNLGLALRLKGDMDRAGAEFREALQLNPKHALAHRSLGLVLREAGDFPAAANELRLAVAALPDDPEGHQLLGSVLLKMNDIPDAIESFQKAVTLAPGFADAYATLAQVLQRAGRKEEAKHQLAELQHLNTTKANYGRAMVLVESAQGHINKDDLAGAIRDLQEAVSLSPNFAEAHYQLGLALVRSPMSAAQAESAFRRVLELDPNDALACLRLGVMLEARGERAEALSRIANAAQLAPGLSEAHREWGRMAVASRDWPTALRELTAVLAWNPDDAGAHFDLANALEASGQREEAAREVEIAHKLVAAPGTPRYH